MNDGNVHGHELRTGTCFGRSSNPNDCEVEERECEERDCIRSFMAWVIKERTRYVKDGNVLGRSFLYLRDRESLKNAIDILKEREHERECWYLMDRNVSLAVLVSNYVMDQRNEDGIRKNEQYKYENRRKVDKTAIEIVRSRALLK